ncbi:ABC transporter substrate-binding protein [Thermoanaerobacter sp. YS13]|uniref:ABC transporter substrate-binding protein n=1 Tax=Thermoanaerobacter sp. YS13 TaxID=1511746 RepID=UPI000689C3D8|nr:ABC transporter substrate-binding protein [Thermoanaerobacter sp. YS13]
MFNRKSVLTLFLLSLFIFSVLFSGCSTPTQSSSQAQADSTPQTSTNEEKTTPQITLHIAARAGNISDALAEMGKKYKEQTNVDVQVVGMPYNELKEAIVLDVKNKGGAYDLVTLDDPWMPEFGEGKLLTNLDSYFPNGLDSDFVEKSVALGKHPYGTGSLYAVPMVGNVQLFYYRKDLLDKYNLTPPKTWDDVLKIAKLITEKEAPNVYGYVIRGQRGNPIVSDFLPVFWAYGGEVIDENNKPHVNSEAGIKAMETYLKLKKYSPKGVETFDTDQIANALTQGQVAMTIAWPAWVSKVDNPESSKVVGKIDFSVVPGQVKDSAAMIGNWLLGIPSTSNNKEEAVKFLKWVTSKEVQKEMALKFGVPPTRKSLYNDKELVEKYRYYPSQLDALEHSVARPRTPYWSQIEDVWGLYLSQIVSGQIGIKEGLDKANSEIEKILK